MLRRVATLAALGVLFSAPAFAGVLLTYPTPTSGDVVYSPNSLIRGDALGFDWIEVVRSAPRVAPRSGDTRIIEPVWADYFLGPDLGNSVDVWLAAAGSGPTDGTGIQPAYGMATLTSHLSPPDAAPLTDIAPELNDF